MVEYIKKRDGSFQLWDKVYIENAVEKAMKAAGVNIPNLPTHIATQVESYFPNEVSENVDIETIQDCVEKELMKAKQYDIAIRYIKYRHERAKEREGVAVINHIQNTVDEYIDGADWRINENANMGHSYQGLILHAAGKTQARYVLDKFGKDVEKAHNEAYLHIHDLSMGLTGYCFTGDTKIRTTDNVNPSFLDVVEGRYTKELEVFSVDETTGELHVAKAINPRLVEKAARLVVVRLDNGSVIRCTPEHEFLTLNNERIKAIDLIPNTSLNAMYLYSKGNGYLASRGKYIHHMVAEYKYGDRAHDTNFAKHHIDGNKQNNNSENIQLVDDAEHRRYHLKLTQQSELWKAGTRACLTVRNKTKEMRESASRRTTARNSSVENRAKVSFALTVCDCVDKTTKMFSSYLEHVTLNGFMTFKQFLNKFVLKTEPANHKVLSVSKLSYTEDVYCLTVPEYGNFTLADSGVIVSNCSGWSLGDLLLEGFNNDGYTGAKPAKRFDVALGQMNNFLGTLQNEWSKKYWTAA